jgi:hypothetical protein
VSDETQLLKLIEQTDPGYLPVSHSPSSILRAFTANSTLVPGEFTPAPGLWKKDSDSYFFFLSPNAIWFRQPTADTWYNSSQTAATSILSMFDEQGDTFNVTYWHAAEPASPLACLEQMQWCFPGVGCTPLAGVYDQASAVRRLTSSNATWTRFDWITNIMTTQPSMINAFDVIGSLGSKSLTSRFSLINGIQGPIADNQWQQDVAFWISTGLASTQQNFINVVTRNFPAGPNVSLIQGESDEEKAVCSNIVSNPPCFFLRHLCSTQAIV